MPLYTPPLTAAQLLAQLLTVDGAGSGLDADLLDGTTSTGYMSATSGTDNGRSLALARGVAFC
jgi:hypothetical protein